MLRGMLGGAAVTLALPRLGIMLNDSGTAYAGGEPLPRRFGVWAWANGVKLDRWVPRQTGADWELSEELQRLANVKEYLTVVSGTEIKSGGRPHANGNTCIMTGARLAGSDSRTYTARGPSIDVIVARHMQQFTPIKSIEVGVNTGAVPESATAMNYFSHNGPNSPNIPSYSCRDVFNRLFMGAAGNGENGERAKLELDLRQNVLDAVREDANDLNKILGSEDRARMEQHLEGIAAIQKRLSSVTPACTIPPAPPEELVGRQNRYDEFYERINLTMAELLATAMACDLTRVFMFQLLPPGGRPEFLDYDGDYHGFTHGGDDDQEKVHNVVIYLMGQFAVLLETLKNTPDVGGGNLLDSCAILATTDVADGKSHSVQDFPILVAGKAGGALRAGIHHRVQNRDNACKVPLTLARAVGVPLDEFGQDEIKVSESLSALEA